MEYRGEEANVGVFRNLDWLTVLLYLVLVVWGAISIYAASYDFDNAEMFDLAEFSGKQFMWIGLGLVLGVVILLLDYRLYEAYAYPIYGAVMILLFLTIFIAPNIKGSHSWLVLGPVSLQPAEFGKFATSLALAKLFDTYNFSLNSSINNYYRSIGIILVPIFLILMQNETGTSLAYFALIFVLYREGMSGMILFTILCAIAIFVITLKYAEPLILGIPAGEFTVFVLVMVIYSLMLLFYCKDVIIARNVIFGFLGSGALVGLLSLCGVNVPGLAYFLIVIFLAIGYTAVAMFHTQLKKFIITIIFAVASVCFMFSVNYAFNHVLQHHQRERIMVTLGITEDIQKAGYNVNQSKIAIGSGGLTGKGFLNGTQTKLKYVPEQHTDFIFCTIGEEEGFIGTVGVLTLFLIFILRIIALAERQKTPFGRVYGYCVASFLIFHICINVGMVLGLCPVIGIPLPFFSYGGSSLWGFTILIFILLRLDAARKER